MTEKSGLQRYEFLTPTIAGFVSKLVSLGLTFPLEYMATLSQADLQSKQKHLSNGFGYTLYRELVYSSCFWTLQEHLYRKVFLPRFQSDRKAYITASFCSSMVSALVSYPFDLFKTWKISYPERFENSNVIRVSSRIVQEKGAASLFAGNSQLTQPGIVPRLLRVGTGNLIFFTAYTKMVQVINSRSSK